MSKVQLNLIFQLYTQQQLILVQQNLMEGQLPMNQFEGKAGQTTFRINFMTEGQSDVSHYTQGLIVYIQDHEKGYCYQQTFTLQTLPKEVVPIFIDIRGLFDYIVDNYQDEKRVKVMKEGLMVCNILKTKSSQRRQQVMLHMTRSPLNKAVGVSKIECYQNPQMKAYMYELLTKNEKVAQETEKMRKQFEQLKALSKQQQIIIKSLQQKQKDQKTVSIQKMHQLQIKIQNMERQHAQTINIIRVEQRYMIECINQLKRELAEQKAQKEELRDNLKELRDNLKKVNLGGPLMFNSKPDALGQKITVTIDRQNQFLNKFKIQNGQIEKIKDDETRYQILGNQIMGKVNKTFFEVKIVKLANGNLLLGVVNITRKGQRHSYNQKECVCFEATGMIFEMGKKYPAVAKAQTGQTIRVVLDLEASMVRWLVGHTEIGSVVLPDNMRNSKLVPYIELNEVGDKIILNG